MQSRLHSGASQQRSRRVLANRCAVWTHPPTALRSRPDERRRILRHISLARMIAAACILCRRAIGSRAYPCARVPIHYPCLFAQANQATDDRSRPAGGAAVLLSALQAVRDYSRGTGGTASQPPVCGFHQGEAAGVGETEILPAGARPGFACGGARRHESGSGHHRG
eukprot:4694069-Prymnesium_polylepis.1